MLHSYKKLFPTHMGTFTMTLLKILDITYHQNFDSLGTSTSHMDNIVFSNL